MLEKELAKKLEKKGAKVEIDWIQAEDVEGLLASDRLRDLDGIVIPGGFGSRGFEGKIAAARFAARRGASSRSFCAQEIERRVVSPLEKAIYEIENVDYIYSTSQPSGGMIIVRFVVGTETQDKGRTRDVILDGRLDRDRWSGTRHLIAVFVEHRPHPAKLLTADQHVTLFQGT